MKSIYNMKKCLIYGVLAFAAASLISCKEEGLGRYDNSWILNNDETMTLEASETYIKLNADALDDVALTFTWSPARPMPEDYILTYVTMLDLKTNQFNASTVQRVLEDEDVFEKSFTNYELQRLIVEKYGKSISEVTTISFKVIAKWEGGDKFVMPESRTIDVDIQPYRPITFDADKVFLGGPAVNGIRPSSNYTMTRTPENEFVYAGEYEMMAGRMTIPIEFDGVTRYICPADRADVNVPDADQVDGKPASTEEYTAVVIDPEGKDEATLPAWNLPSDGYWRVIIDMENKTVRFFSPKNRLEPLTAQFNFAGTSGWILEKTFIGGTYYVRNNTGWDSWTGKGFEFVASKIDPQMLYYLGSPISAPGGTGICIKTGTSISDGFSIITEGTGTGENNPNEANAMKFASKVYSFVPEGNVDTPMTKGKWMPMQQMVSNRSWTYEGGSITINKISIDLRNNKIRFD